MQLFNEQSSDTHRVLAYQVWRFVAEGADLHACERTMRQVHTTDDWLNAWTAAADKFLNRAVEALALDRCVTARENFLQASIFYRSAELFLNEDSELKTATYLRCRDAFERARPFFRPVPLRVEVPYLDTRLPGFLYVPPHGVAPFPGVVYLGGSDDCKEELHSSGAQGIVDRGMVCLTLDTPGKGETLRVHKLPTRPDFEVVATAALDYLTTCPEVDADRIGVIGVSMGGYYAARSAAFEKRFKACVCWNALYDVAEGLYDHLPLIRPQLHYIMGARSAAEGRRLCEQYTLKGVMENVTCPLLITHGADDNLIPVAEAHRAYAAATGPKELMVWDDGGHVCVRYYDEVRQVMWDWMHARLSA